MMKQARNIALGVAAALVIGTSSASAAPLLPGTSLALTPIEIGLLPGSTLEASGSFTDSSASGALDVYVYAEVYRNLLGTLDFYYQVTNMTSSTVSANRETEFDFSGYYTGVSQTNVTFGGFQVGTQSLGSVDRSAEGTIGFNFDGIASGPNSLLNPGETSYIKIIRTNAVDFTVGYTSVINGGVAEGVTFAPAGAPVPEPGSMMLLGTGLFGLAGAARRRLRRA